MEQNLFCLPTIDENSFSFFFIVCIHSSLCDHYMLVTCGLLTLLREEYKSISLIVVMHCNTPEMRNYPDQAHRYSYQHLSSIVQVRHGQLTLYYLND